MPDPAHLLLDQSAAARALGEMWAALERELAQPPPDDLAAVADQIPPLLTADERTDAWIERVASEWATFRD